MDKGGRGFLGFTSREIWGPGSKHTTIVYDPMKRQPNGAKYTYPYALLPASVFVDVDTTATTNPHSRALDSTTYTPASSVWKPNGTYLVLPTNVDHYDYDCQRSDSPGSCAGTPRTLGYRKTALVHDDYGNVTSSTTTFYDGEDRILRTDSVFKRYQAADLGQWLLSLPDPERPDLQQSVVQFTDVWVRTVRLTPDLSVNAATGLKVGTLQSIETEPFGTNDVHLLRTFGRDTRGRLTSIADTEFETNTTRSTTFVYQPPSDDPDSVHVAQIIKPYDQTTKIWRHPGLGVVVEVDDPNNLAAVTSYDTFGRVLSETGASGATTAYSYGDGAANGIDVFIKPENLATRQITVHYDSWGRENSRTTPVDATRTLVNTTIYDNRGLPLIRQLTSGGTLLNEFNEFYDDLGRRLTTCHLTSNNTKLCSHNFYEGLTVSTYDESLQTTTTTVDALGRVVKKTAALQGGTSDAIFTYGEFGLLRQERTSDGTGQTDIRYDVLGRPTKVTRTLAGTRVTRYNAFGEVTKTYKDGGDWGDRARDLRSRSARAHHLRNGLRNRPQAVLGQGSRRFGAAERDRQASRSL